MTFGALQALHHQRAANAAAADAPARMADSIPTCQNAPTNQRSPVLATFKADRIADDIWRH